MNKPHKHAELIKAWADGAKIEVNDPSFSTPLWQDVVDPPSWKIDLEYRIKPEPKPDISVNKFCFLLESVDICYTKDEDIKNASNVQFIFDGETRKLKAVKLI